MFGRTKALFSAALLCTALLSTAPVRAEEAPAKPESTGSSGATAPSASSYGGGGSFSVLAGKSVGAGNTVVHGEAGWPGISAAFWHGAGPKLDIGGKFSLLYAYEGIVQLGGNMGLKAQGLLRVSLLERGRLNLGLKFMPGLFAYFRGGSSEMGLVMPIDLTLGFQVMPQLMLSAGMDFPMFVVFGPWGGVAFPMRIGMGLEYAIDRTLAVTFSLRGGPAGLVGTYYYYPYYGAYTCIDRFGRPYFCAAPGLATMEMLVGIAYRM